MITSLRKRFLQQPNLFPPDTTKPNQLKSSKSNDKKTTTSKSKNTNTQEDLFEGAIFHFVRPEIHHTNSEMIAFDTEKFEGLITTYGGHKLSKQIISALQKENTTNNKLSSQKKQDRICYIVNITGNYDHNYIISKSKLLLKVYKEQLCTFVPVTPIWIEACISNGIESRPEKYPLFFQPRWPMYTLPSDIKVKVSVTGFQNAERIGLKQMLIAIGATYTENMGRGKNTHLICKEAKGPKYHKAIEWGLYVVTVDWLHHIVKNGYSGKNGRVTGRGCEKNFSLSFSPRRVQPVINKAGVENMVKDQAFICKKEDF